MNATLDCPVLGLETKFPSRLYILQHEPSGKYGCFCANEIHGLACFSDETSATDFADMIGLENMTNHHVSFDEAREVAKGRPLPVVSLMLLDDISSPEIHFVR